MRLVFFLLLTLVLSFGNAWKFENMKCMSERTVSGNTINSTKNGLWTNSTLTFQLKWLKKPINYINLLFSPGCALTENKYFKSAFIFSKQKQLYGKCFLRFCVWVVSLLAGIIKFINVCERLIIIFLCKYIPFDESAKITATTDAEQKFI